LFAPKISLAVGWIIQAGSTEDGIAIGLDYTAGPERSFLFRPDFGLLYVDELVAGGLAGEWTSLGLIYLWDPARIIVGRGRLASGIGRCFAMHPPACGWTQDACFADYNDDGGIDGDDVISFFTDWDASGPCSDVDASGGVDGDDIIAFFSIWDVGGAGQIGC
jgi:hypothetical protein